MLVELPTPIIFKALFKERIPEFGKHGLVHLEGPIEFRDKSESRIVHDGIDCARARPIKIDLVKL